MLLYRFRDLDHVGYPQTEAAADAHEVGSEPLDFPADPGQCVQPVVDDARFGYVLNLRCDAFDAEWW
jgi:hypothetical protein